MECKTSIRECKYCLEPGFSIPNRVMVTPHYNYRVRTGINPTSSSEISTVVITERFICPSCGELVVNDYEIDLTQKDMQFIVDNIVEGKK